MKQLQVCQIMQTISKPGATQCLLPVLNDSIVWCTMKGLCHVFFAFVMLLCDLIVPDILEYCTNVRYWVWLSSMLNEQCLILKASLCHLVIISFILAFLNAVVRKVS
ncbi:Palmitoyltransferase akr1 [Labeo rohita]|uniref:Palmitoyltransferase akr1 n=1 Tax=Labeo rohita TaxID=84645 RepID=A0ABQ8LTR5_LABRO|nr:Palmitoyltransferase akr1 [Labeo rohita]